MSDEPVTTHIFTIEELHQHLDRFFAPDQFKPDAKALKLPITSMQIRAVRESKKAQAHTRIDVTIKCPPSESMGLVGGISIFEPGTLHVYCTPRNQMIDQEGEEGSSE